MKVWCNWHIIVSCTFKYPQLLLCCNRIIQCFSMLNWNNFIVFRKENGNSPIKPFQIFNIIVFV